jgi:hypothetical protein
MKTKSMIKKVLMGCLLLQMSLVNAQIKLNAAGNFGVGTTNPQVPLHFVGNVALFTNQATGLPLYAAMIRGTSGFSGPTTPEYTWFNNDQVGMFHPSGNNIGFSTAGTAVMYIHEPWANFKLEVLGNAVATGGSFQSSDIRFKKNILNIQNPIELILKMRGVTYEYKKEEFKRYNFEEGKKIGFIAQELNEIIPEAVKIDGEGYLAVNYSAIIPLLVEAIKEQQKEINELKRQNIPSSARNTITTGIDKAELNVVSTNITEDSHLFQNAPNPFNIETTIKYVIPNSAKNVNIFVYDVSGNKRKTFSINETGTGSVKIAANELGQGIYFYSMLVDGKVIDSKTMLITE